MRRRYLVEGAVQGVGFRYFAWRQGRKLELSGWVRNLPTGQVEALADGEPELLAQFEGLLRKGPSMASVTSLGITDLPDDKAPLGSFEIR